MTRHENCPKSSYSNYQIILLGLTIVTAAELYASYGEDIFIQSPHAEVHDHEWQFPERNEILAYCTNEKVALNSKLKRSHRLNITTNCSLQIHNLTQDDIGLYKCFRLGKDNSTKHTYEINIKLRSKFFFNLIY